MNTRTFSSLFLGLVLASCATVSTTSESAAKEGMMYYVVDASGGAWSASAKARAVMESVDGISELHMSGARAVFQLENGAELDEEQLAAAFEEQGMALESVESVRRPRASRMYLVDAAVTWAVTAGEVRAALIEETGALDVYFEDEIEILMTGSKELDEAALEQVLTAQEVEYSNLEEVVL